MLALKLLWRNWRSGELKLLSASLVLAVAVVSGIAVFTDRLQSTMVHQSNAIIGADAVVQGSQLHKDKWQQQADQQGILSTRSASFRSMLYAKDEMTLASIKAVANAYPLRGQFEVSQTPFAQELTDIQIIQGIPKRGEAWIDSRLLALLDIKLGDQVEVGDYALTVSQFIIREPDAFVLTPRLLMNIDDLPLTHVVLPGSQISYKWLLAHDNQQTLDNFVSELKPQLGANHSLTDQAASQARLKQVLTPGKTFLLLTAVIAVLLSGIAIAITARQFSHRHSSQVALLKSLGSTTATIRQLYFVQLFILAMLASAVGLVIGHGIQQVIAASLSGLYKVTLEQPQIMPYALSFFSGVLCLIFFALPALWFLPKIAPLKILRRDLSGHLPQVWLQALLAFSAVILLVLLFSRDWQLALIITGALMVSLTLSYLFALLLLSVSQYFTASLGGHWRLAFSNLQRHKGQSLLLIVVLSTTFMLLLTMNILRSSIVDEWQANFPETQNNAYLINIAGHSVNNVEAALDNNNISHDVLTPSVRGRLTHINNQEPDEALVKSSWMLSREIGLTSKDKLGKEQSLASGVWWEQVAGTSAAPLTSLAASPSALPATPRVSITQEAADELTLTTGDQLIFSIGGLALNAEIASIRVVDESANNVSTFVFEPGSLDSFSPTYYVGMHIQREQLGVINQVLREQPNVSFLDFKQFMEQIRQVINQITDAITLILWLTLACGCMVLLAAVLSSIDGRKQESGLLRALGSSRKLMLGSIGIEFCLLGLIAGFIGILGAEFLLMNVQRFVLNTPISLHYPYWLLAPVLSALFIAGLGISSCRSVVTTPPNVVLREAN